MRPPLRDRARQRHVEGILGGGGRRRLFSLEQRRHRDLPLVALEEGDLPRRLDVPKLLEHRAVPLDDAVGLGLVEHLAVPRAQLVPLHRPALLGRPGVENVLVVRARRLDPQVDPLEAAHAARIEVGAQQRAVGGGAVAGGSRPEVADRVDVRDVDAARVGLRAVGVVLLRVHHEDCHVTAVDFLEGQDAPRAVRELGGVRLATGPLSLDHLLLGLGAALHARDDAHSHGLTGDARCGQGSRHAHLQLPGELARRQPVRLARRVIDAVAAGRRHQAAAAHPGRRGSRLPLARRAASRMAAGRASALVDARVVESTHAVLPHLASSALHPVLLLRVLRRFVRQLPALPNRNLHESGQRHLPTAEGHDRRGQRRRGRRTTGGRGGCGAALRRRPLLPVALRAELRRRDAKLDGLGHVCLILP
mmetsp:Transcript_10563/g.35051  ORF Transcript_10563/g.35051 Transcript_10563/m.35051 type:complete len:420 (-) Transcript_10563:1264-2523(-)